MEAHFSLRKTKAGKMKGTFSGSLAVANAKSIHGYLSQLLDSPEDIMISIEKVEDIDLSFIQLLYSFRLHVNQLGRTISIQESLEDKDKVLLHRLNLLQVLTYDSRNA